MIKQVLNFFLIFMLCITNQAICVVILVHGPYESHSNWCNPGGNFYQELEKSAKALDQKLIPFSWTGLPTDEYIIKGAESLAKIILSYPRNEKIIIIGHGQGGNVINFATQLLFDPKQDFIQTTTTENNISTDISILISQAYKEINSKKLTTPETSERVKKALENIHKCIEERKDQSLNEQLLDASQQQYLIEKVCLISPTVDIEKFAPQMNIIKNVYSYYSTSTPTIPLFEHEKFYPKQDRVINFKVQFLNYESFTIYNPTPIEILNPIIARWILYIPEKLQEEKIGFFENFAPQQDAKIQFSEGKKPVYLGE